MKRTITYYITNVCNGQSILEYLKAHYYSTAIIAHLKRTEDGILNNGIWARVREILHTGDVLTINMIETSGSPNVISAALPLSIVYEDEDVMVINKPAGMPVHPSQGNYGNTLANAVCYYFKQQGESFVYRCITRLDRDTTGLLLLAKHIYSASLLSKALAEKGIHREYLAVVLGCTPDHGVIDAPIGRVPGSTIERQVDELNGQPARTRYQKLCFENGYSLIALALETGRTHQIRVHLNHIGHPLPGDFLYYPNMSVIHRQALHSHCLRFHHPITGDLMQFTAELPDDMQQFFT